MPEFEWVGSGAPSSTNFSTVGSGFTVNNAQGSGFDVQFTVTEIGPGFSEIQTSTSNVYDDTGTAPNTLGNDSLYLEGNGNGNGNDTLAVELQFFDTSSGDRDNVDGVEFFINDIDFCAPLVPASSRKCRPVQYMFNDLVFIKRVEVSFISFNIIKFFLAGKLMIPDAQLVKIEESGHFPELETPDLVAGYLNEFIHQNTVKGVAV